MRTAAGILAGTGLVCLVYYGVIIFYVGLATDFAWIWLAGGIVLEGAAFGLCFLHHHGKVLPGWIWLGGGLILGAGLLLALYLGGLVVSAMGSKGSKDLDYVVVLGAHVQGETPSKALRKRLEAALDYGEKNPDTILVLTGGQGYGEDITEAECMRRWLTQRGIPEERLVLEDKSTSTRENLLFARELTGCHQKKTGILSNDFHIYRALQLARKLGYEQAEGIAASSDVILQPHSVVREIFALVKERIMGNI